MLFTYFCLAFISEVVHLHMPHAVEDLRFEDALRRDGSYRTALPAALASGDRCRVLESHGDQVRASSA